MIITIDGPVASGKSSVAKALAKELGIYYLYTGLLYRAVAYVLLQMLHKKEKKGITNETLADYVATLSIDSLKFIDDLSYDYGKNEKEDHPYLFYCDEDITQHLYDASLDQPASIVSANLYVRAALLDLQQNVSKKYDIVADGRDCGSVIFPSADYKFYLTARSEIRAQRLMFDEKRGDVGGDVQKIKADVEQRDKRDKERAIAPLMVPENAIIIDNSDITEKETIAKFLGHIKR